MPHILKGQPRNSIAWKCEHQIVGECDKCGRVTSALHLPGELHGFYCRGCCPACKVTAKAA